MMRYISLFKTKMDYLQEQKMTVLETFGFVSLASDAKDSVGNSNYYRDVIESQSQLYLLVRTFNSNVVKFNQRTEHSHKQ